MIAARGHRALDQVGAREARLVPHLGHDRHAVGRTRGVDHQGVVDRDRRAFLRDLEDPRRQRVQAGHRIAQEAPRSGSWPASRPPAFAFCTYACPTISPDDPPGLGAAAREGAPAPEGSCRSHPPRSRSSCSWCRCSSNPVEARPPMAPRPGASPTALRTQSTGSMSPVPVRSVRELVRVTAPHHVEVRPAEIRDPAQIAVRSGSRSCSCAISLRLACASNVEDRGSPGNFARKESTAPAEVPRECVSRTSESRQSGVRRGSRQSMQVREIPLRSKKLRC